MEPIDPALVNVRVADIMPGCWIDGNGNAHFSVPEIHAHLGITDNSPESIAETMRILGQMLSEEQPETLMVYRLEP